MLVSFEIAEVSLQGKGCQEEVGLLPLDTLREKHLFPKVPVVVVPGHPIAAGQKEQIQPALRITGAKRNDLCESNILIIHTYYLTQHANKQARGFTDLINRPFST